MYRWKKTTERIRFCTDEKPYRKNKIMYRWKKTTERIRLCTDEKPYWKDKIVYRWKTLLKGYECAQMKNPITVN